MLSNHTQIDNYDYAGNDPMSWHRYADKLLSAANILKVERDKYYDNAAYVTIDDGSIPAGGKILDSEIMLRGFATEVLLKAIYLKHGNKLASNGKLLKIPGVGSHKLLQLANKVGFKLNNKEKNLFIRLEVYMTSMGRYPISTLWENTKIPKAIGGPPTYWSMPTDDNLYSELVCRMLKEIES